MSSITNILVNILGGEGIGSLVLYILYILLCIISRVIFLVTPLFVALVYAFFTSKKIYTKILYFLGSILCELLLFNWLYADNLSLQDIQTRFFKYSLVCFFLYYIITTVILIRKSKKMSTKILSVIVVNLIFCFFTIFYIERGEIQKEDSDNGSRVYMYELKRDIREHVVTYKEYPIYEDGISGKLERYPPQVYGTWNTGVLYGLTQKRYTINDNPNLMVAWDKESHGVILKWRYVVFVGKEEPEVKIVSEGKFQKLLKNQQGLKEVQR